MLPGTPVTKPATVARPFDRGLAPETLVNDRVRAGAGVRK